MRGASQPAAAAGQGLGIQGPTQNWVSVRTTASTESGCSLPRRSTKTAVFISRSARHLLLRAGPDLTLAELQEHLRGQLSLIELPRQLETRHELPKTTMGKLSRLALRQELSLSSAK